MTWEVMGRHLPRWLSVAILRAMLCGDGGPAMRQIILGAAAAGLLAMGASACALAAEKADPAWVTTPPKESWYSAWPAKARAAGVGGWAVMGCHLEDDGALSGCRAIHESPSGQGFGAALVSLAGQYRHKAPTGKASRDLLIPGDWFELDTPPDWLRKPSPEQLVAVYPKQALAQGIAGRAVVGCLVTPQGVLMDCVPLSETPAGSGFGSAAVALTPQFLMKPGRRKGVPVVSMVAIPINWEGMGGRPTEIIGSRRVVPGELPWAEAPSYTDVAAAYPKKAQAEKLAGRATLACALSEQGRLNSCDVATVEPRGYGFDTAAKALAKQFRFEVATDADRKATRSVDIHLTMVFDPSMLGVATPLVGKPRWAALPKAEQMQATFAGLGVTGTARVTLECTVQQGGSVSGCRVASEDPAGKGVGTAALSLAPAFRLTTWTAEGLPTVGGTVRIPIRYESDAPAAAAAK